MNSSLLSVTDNSYTYYPYEMEDTLVSYIKLNKADMFLKTLDIIVETVKKYPYLTQFTILFRIESNCMKTIHQKICQDNNGFCKLNDIFSTVKIHEYIKDCLRRLFDEYRQVVEGIHALNRSRHYHMIKEMQYFINENYWNINLSVKSLADIYGYTSYYLSKIFRDITGTSITGYIRIIRIKKAKELLNLKDSKVGDVSKEVGFISVTHFYHVFKKEVGLTPSSYREYILQDKKIT